MAAHIGRFDDIYEIQQYFTATFTDLCAEKSTLKPQGRKRPHINAPAEQRRPADFGVILQVYKSRVRPCSITPDYAIDGIICTREPGNLLSPGTLDQV